MLPLSHTRNPKPRATKQAVKFNAIVLVSIIPSTKGEMKTDKRRSTDLQCLMKRLCVLPDKGSSTHPTRPPRQAVDSWVLSYSLALTVSCKRSSLCWMLLTGEVFIASFSIVRDETFGKGSQCFLQSSQAPPTHPLTPIQTNHITDCTYSKEL